MGQLTATQRNTVYLQAAERTGIHKPILAALYQVQQKPVLTDGETGLGISPANRISIQQVNQFDNQVQFAANTIRSLINSLTVEGWKGPDLWQSETGCYSDLLLQAIAGGYTTPVSDPNGALLEASDKQALRLAYLEEVQTDHQAAKVPDNLSYLDSALLTFIEQLPYHYIGLSYQREALLEAVRLWRKLDTRESAIAALKLQLPKTAETTGDESVLNPVLLQFIQRISSTYTAYPHQREALLRLTQLWQQLDSREAAIASLTQTVSPKPHQNIVDPALIDLVQRIPQSYKGKGYQRHALVEGFRLWQQISSRSAALEALGVNPDLFSKPNPGEAELIAAATQTDRALLDFIRRIPTRYQGQKSERDALIRLAQLWRNSETPEQTIQSLLENLQQMQQARKDAPEAPLKPLPLVLSHRPDFWTPETIQLFAPIIPDGAFTWAEATQGGIYMPPNQAAIEAIVRTAQLAQQVRDRLDRPFSITRWYCPSDPNTEGERRVNHRHAIGDAIEFYCEGLTGNQLYWFLDPWWPGGLGRYAKFPYLCQLDARSYRARWLH